MIISILGPPGVSKTTHVNLLKEHFQNENVIIDSVPELCSIVSAINLITGINLATALVYAIVAGIITVNWRRGERFNGYWEEFNVQKSPVRLDSQGILNFPYDFNFVIKYKNFLDKLAYYNFFLIKAELMKDNIFKLIWSFSLM